MVEAVTVPRVSAVPFWAFVIKLSLSKFFDIKILPATYCSP
jgi:hypothetical protein